MNRRRALLASLALPSLWAAACSGDHSRDANPSDAGADTSFAATPALGSDAGLQEASAAAPQSFFRVAHLSPDLPRMDVCVAAHGTKNFVGPLVAQLSGGDASASGLSYAQVSGYVAVAPGAYDVRIIESGSASCVAAAADADAGEGSALDGGDDAAAVDGATDAAPDDGGLDASPDGGSPDGEAGAAATAVLLAPDTTDLPGLANNTYSTLLLAGARAPTGNDPALTVTVLRDDAALAGGGASLRAVNAVLAPGSLDFGLGSFASGWIPLFTNVAFARASSTVAPSAGAADTNGYLPIAPLAGQVVSVRASTSPTTDTAVDKNAQIALGSVATVFAIGGKTGDSAHPRAILVCLDNGPVGGALAACSGSP